MAKRKRYTDKFKAGAIALLQSEGYPDDASAVMRVSRHLDVPGRTLRRWHNGSNGQPPDDVVQDTKKELGELFEKEIREVLNDLPHAREDASYRDLVTGIAILVDKRQLLNGQPTEHVKQSGDLSDSERAARLAALLDTARTRRNGSPVGEVNN